MRNNLMNYTKLGLVIAGAALAGVMVASPAQAAKHTTVKEQLSHFAECLQLMHTDPAKHAELCGPGHTVFYENFANHSGKPAEEPCPPPCWDPCWPPCWEGGEISYKFRKSA